MTKISYRGSFYTDRRARTALSAEAILGLVFDQWPAKSVVDVGCGTGTWLTVAHSLGSTRLVGVEGDWVTHSMLDSPDIDLLTADIAEDLVTGERFDLAICLEVAEHLPPERGPSLVADLCRLSDLVLFGAAIPGQGGTGHINERWQSYWCDLFRDNSYQSIDLVRPAIWYNEDVQPHYRQNSVLYVRSTSKTDAAESLALFDVVHPGILRQHTHPGLLTAWRQILGFPAATLRTVKRRLSQ